jgi:hypothetical protein
LPTINDAKSTRAVIHATSRTAPESIQSLLHHETDFSQDQSTAIAAEIW